MSSLYSIVSEQGPRGYMEDRYFFTLNLGGKAGIYGGVYDGHTSEKAAEYATKHLHQKFFEFLSTLNPIDAFINAYEITSDEIKEELLGTCAADFFIKDGLIYFANVGDARIIVVGKEERQLTTDHRVIVEAERKRIEAQGGRIIGPYAYRDAYGLMPTRTLGDQYLKEIGIIATPSVGSYKILPEDKFLIAGTDGLFDFMANSEVASIAREIQTPEKVAQALKEEVLLKRQGRDNLTIIVLALKSD